MAEKPNPFLKLLNQVKADTQKAVPAPTPKAEEKKISESPEQGLTSPAKTDTPVSRPAQEKTDLAQSTPAPQLLLGAAIAPKDDEADKPESNGDLQPYDMQELAMVDTENMEPTNPIRRVPNLNVKAANMAKSLTLESPASVRELCDKLDAMIGERAAPDLQGPQLIDIRNYVQTLMVTLKSRPEFDSVIIDKDVRNVMKFIRATRQEALELRDVKTEKKATRSAKKEVTSSRAKGFESAFNAIMFGAPKFGDK